VHSDSDRPTDPSDPVAGSDPSDPSSGSDPSAGSSGPGPGPGGHDGFDVAGVGNALVDLVATVDDAHLARLGLVKGAMELVDATRSAAIRQSLGAVTRSSGGSAANTMAGIASLGGRAAFIGRVADDPLGRDFTEDITGIGVAFHPDPVPGDDRSVTGHSVVLVTADAQRTMATHLGVASELGEADLRASSLGAAGVVYLEGYLWEQPTAKAAMRRAIELAHAGDGSVALTLSDPFCVERHRQEFLDLLAVDVDIVFANEEEAAILTGTRDVDAAARALGELGVLAVVTRGAAGCVVVMPTGTVPVPAAPAARVVDTTGAGDLFAAGFLYGITHGLDPEDSARLGGVCAAEVISHVGARPLVALHELGRSAGLVD